MTTVLVIKGERHTGLMPHEGGDRDWSEDAATDQGMSKTMGSCQKLGGGPATDPPSQTPEGADHIDTLISDFQPPELWENECLLF